jgi:hypothetical protein
MKKTVGIIALGLLLFGFAGQSMAALAANDLIRVVYVDSAFGGTEYVTDLGSTSSILTANNTVGAGSLAFAGGTGFSLSNIHVAYFSVPGGTGSPVWLSGSTTTPDLAVARKEASLTNAINALTGSYASLSAGQTATGKISDGGSYFSVFDGGGTNLGSMAGYVYNITNNVEVNLGSGDGQKVAQGLWTWANGNPTTRTAGTFADILQTNFQWIANYDSHDVLTGYTATVLGTTIDPQTASVPVPPSMILLGTGLLGLIGLRRKGA